MTDKLRDAAPLLPCPFCGDDGDKGTQAVTLMNAERTSFRRVSCRCCGATCPEPNWNHRAARAQQDAQKKHKPLFAEMIAQHPGLAEELAQQDAHMQPAGDADMTVYRGIAANYHKDKADLTQQDAQAVPPSDTDLRRLWAAHAAKMHGWASNAIPAMHDTGNGPRFECSWHEQEFGVFKAGYLAASQSAPTPPAQSVALTDDEIEDLARGKSGHSDFARAVIEAYETKNGINRG